VRFFNYIKGLRIDLGNHFLFVMVLLSIMISISCESFDEVTPDQGEIYIKLFGGNGTEEGKDLMLLPDGGFVVVGSSTSTNMELAANNGGKDVFVVRTDNKGDVLWQSLNGGEGDDIGTAVLLGPDGNSIYVCGEKTQNYGPNPGNRDVFVLNYSLDGALLGEYTFGDTLRDEYGTDITSTPTAGFLITSTWLTGDTSKYFIVETDGVLNALSQRSRYVAGSEGVINLSERSYERGNIGPLEPPFACFGSAQQLIGSNKVFKFQSFYYQTNNDDAISEILYGPDDTQSYCTDVKMTSDGGYVMCGYNEVSDELNREMVVRLNSRRELIGDLHFYDNEFGRRISDPGVFQTNDGGYIVISTIELDDPLNDEISLLRLNAGGDEQWRKTYGSNDNDIGANIIQLEDGSFVLVGTVGFEINPDSQSKMCLMKMNPDGDLVPME
jgi:hypothetical protein